MQVKKELFAGDFGGQEPLRQVRDLVFGVKPGPFRRFARQPGKQIVDTVALQGRNHEDALKGKGRRQLLRQCQELLPLDLVDLVDCQEDATSLALPQALNHQRGLLIVRRLASIVQNNNKIRILNRIPSGSHHCALKPSLRRDKDARGVDKDELRLVTQRDAAHSGPRRLYLVRDDRYLGTHCLIHQGGFTGIRRPRESDHRATRRHSALPSALIRSSRAPAAACSAARLDRPWPSAGSSPSTWTRTVKIGS